MKTTEKTTSECLKKLLESDGTVKTRVVTFTGATLKSVPRWSMGNGPFGVYLIRLRVFLAESGYTPIEFANIDENVFTFARLFAHRLISIDDAMKETGFTNSQSLQRVMNGDCRTSKQAIAKMKRLNTLHSAKLNPLPSLQNFSKEKFSEVPAVSTPSFVPHKELSLAMLAHVVSLAKPFAEALKTADLTQEDCKNFRVLCGYDAVTKTSTILNRLLR